ncbi:MAG TPA: uroporphyrinogen decarboxylase family protein [Anaerolinea sp.]|nr:uroporphyrinogen decarboxylase family protein [Anaerolinea sp.]
MNKRDAVLSLLDGGSPPAAIPAAFFLHFDPAFHRGEAAVRKHMEYFRHTGMDFVKIQYEGGFPRVESIRQAADWAKMPFYGLDFYEEPLRVVEGLVREAKKEALVVLTLYSPFMLAGNAAGDQATVARHIQEDPEAFKRGIGVITESLMGFVKACIRLGLDGFYTSTQGGEAGRFDDPSLFDQCVRPYDLALMDEINRACPFNILHVCDYHLPYADISRFADYPGQVVNCSLELTGGKISAKQAADLFGRPFMGGLDRKGVLATGTPEQVRQAAREVCAEAPARFILGADCTVPSDTPWDNLRAAIDTAHAFRGGAQE